jgi:3-methyladenine DNA glycosylase AlkD
MTMNELEALGTAQNRKVYPRHGAREPIFGVSYANIGRLAKRIGRDQALAERLWATGNHDARVLATRIAAPEALTPRLANAWVRDCDNYVLVEALAGLVAASSIAYDRAEAWRGRRAEWVCSAGWAVTAHLATSPDEVLSAKECDRLLRQIAAGIDGSPNRVRHEMNAALIAIGSRGGHVERLARRSARRIGTVEVDHGQTGCKTPAALPYLDRIAARRGRG